MLCHHWLRVLSSGGSFRLATIAGIRVGVSASWFLILFLYIFWFQDRFTQVLGDSTLGFTTAVLTALGFFASILLHELGHAVAARREGIGVSDVELFMFGGFTRMDRAAVSPGQEFRIAAAGPLVTLLIALVGFAVGVGLMGFDEFRDAATIRGTAPSDVFELWLSFLVSINVLLLAFNLVPAFPLDGGRIAQSIAWRVTGDRTKAVRLAASLGLVFAAVLIGWGVYQFTSSADAFGGLWYIVLGWMLGSSARAALTQSAFTQRLEGVTVADVMDAEPVTIPAGIPVGQAWEEFFLRYHGWEWFPVVEDDGRWAGIAHRAAIEQVADAEATLPMRRVATPAVAEGSIASDAPLEALLGSEPLQRLGAIMAVDREGVLRGVVTIEQVARALKPVAHTA
jgi:Zn-dependent protease/CBS domain-containing protein